MYIYILLYIYYEKYNRLLIYHVCVINCVKKYLNVKFKEDIYFVNEVET